MLNFYEVWFSNVQISNGLKLKLLNKFQNCENIWNMNEKDFLEIELKENDIKMILEDKIKLITHKYIKYLEKYKIKLICCKSLRYPQNLKYIMNNPAFLYVRGSLENLNNNCISIVGSRNATQYGKYIARKFAKEIADKGYNIVSGLAIGIDKYAHLGGLDSKNGRTIAVLGTGISDTEIYPLENKKIFERIIENNGTIISEFKLGTKPEKYNFPLRNRIISGLSEKIIVVEAKEKSGSLITVDYALEQGKEIYAVPGNITSENSIGTNKLIAEGAYLLRNIEDLFLA